MAGVTDLAALIGSLEKHLGDPFDPDLPLSFASALEHDERETYPHVPLAALHAWSTQDFSVPPDAGGRAIDLQDTLALVTQVARRDAATAMAMCTTSLAYMLIWVAGTPAQRRYYGQRVLGGAKMCWGLTEGTHGSDVLANEMSARKVDGGYLVTGRKWLIGNGTLADHLVLFVRTDDHGGPGGFSILVADRASVPPDQVQPLPKQRLHGVRGVDTSGFELTECFVPASGLIGAEGQGLEIMLKASHPIRVMVTALAQGCADTALRLTMDFAVSRTLFGKRVFDLPVSRRALVGCFADLLITEVVATCAARSLQVVPEQSSVFSAVAKHLVPFTLSRTVRELSTVLGARHYLRDHHRFGMVQKIIRDLPITGFADGNSVVNLKNIALQLDTLVQPTGSSKARLLFDWDADLPEYRPEAAQPFHRGGDEVMQALGLVRSWASDQRLVQLGSLFAEKLASLRGSPGQSAELFSLAEQYTVVHAAAACIGHAVHSGGWLDGTPLSGELPLLLCLEQLWQRFEPYRRFTTPSDIDAGAEILLALHSGGKSFGFRQFPLSTWDPS